MGEMLPVLLYNNMEESSNELNNGASSGFGLAYDSSVILNSVRTRKKVTELPNCPVCSCTIRQGELETHMALEVDRLHKISTGTKRKLSVTSPSSNLSMPGCSSSTSTSAATDTVTEETEVDVTGCLGSDVYQRVHHNRLRRLRSRARRMPAETGECPVCDVTLPVTKLQRHALRCLKRTGAQVDDDVPDSSSEEGSIDVENDSPNAAAASGGSFGAEYQWCGEWRVRATALQETGASAATAVRRVSNEHALVVDGDEDTELYGPPQYSPSRIAPDMAPMTEDPPELPNGTEAMDSPEEPEAKPAETQNGGRRSNGVVEASAETRIQALKCRIKELEARQNSGSEAKCLICLGPHTSPAVSIQCWHVYCEGCWLESLRAKKICPQCNAITTAQHLRRIYM